MTRPAHLGPLTEALVFHVKDCALRAGGEKPPEAFTKGSGMTWSCSREQTPTGRGERVSTGVLGAEGPPQPSSRIREAHGYAEATQWTWAEKVAGGRS